MRRLRRLRRSSRGKWKGEYEEVDTQIYPIAPLCVYDVQPNIPTEQTNINDRGLAKIQFVKRMHRFPTHKAVGLIHLSIQLFESIDTLGTSRVSAGIHKGIDWFLET